MASIEHVVQIWSAERALSEAAGAERREFVSELSHGL
jgi:hypothetical protein